MKFALLLISLCYIQWSLASDSYLIVLPKLFKVDSTNEISITIGNVQQPAEISFELKYKGFSQRAQATVRPGETQNVTLTLPKQCPVGVAELIIQGTGGVKFTERRDVITYDDRYVLLVQTTSTTYRPNDTVEIRVVATDENLIPVESGELYIDIYDSRMRRVADFKRVQIRNGLSDVVQYRLPEQSQTLTLGNWMVSATMENVTSSVEILISRPTQSGFDMKVLFPHFLLRSEKSFRGFIEIADDCDKPIFGRATVAIGQITEQDLISGEPTDRVMGQDDFKVPTGLRTKVIDVNGRVPMDFDLMETFGVDLTRSLALTVYVSVTAQLLGQERFIKYIIPIFNRDVIYDIRPLEFVAGEKNEYEIIAKRPDGKPAKIEEMLVNVTMLFETDAPKTIEIRELYARDRTDIGLFNFEIPANCIGVYLTLTPMGEDGKHRGYRTQRVALMPLPARRETGAKLSLEIVADKTGLRHRSSSTMEPVTTMMPTVGRPAYFYVQLLPMKSMKRYETFPLTYVVLTNGKITSTGTFNIEPTKYCTIAPRSIQPEQEDSSKPLRCVFNSTLEIMMTRQMLPYSTLLVYGFNPVVGISVAESYRFSVDGLFRNNLTMSTRERETGTDQSSTPRDDIRRREPRLDLVFNGLSESTVGVNVISYDAIVQGLPNDITKERLLRYMISYESTPLVQGLPISGQDTSSSPVVMPREVSGEARQPRPLSAEEERLRKHHQEHILRVFLRKMAFGLRCFDVLKSVAGDDAYITRNMEHLYADKKSNLRDVVKSRKYDYNNKQYRVGENEWNVQVGMLASAQSMPRDSNEEHSDEPENQMFEGEHFQAAYGTKEWYQRMSQRTSMISREAFTLMHSGLAFVTDFSSLFLPKEMHHMDYNIIRNYRDQYLTKEQCPREAARLMLEDYFKKADSSLVIPSNILDEHTRASYYRSIVFNRTQLDRNGQGRLSLPTMKPYTTWLATGFSLNPTSGLAIAEPTLLRTPEGLYIIAETPRDIQVGERCTLTYAICNHFKKNLDSVVLRIRSSPDFDLMEQQSGKVIPMTNDFTMKVPALKPESAFRQSMVIVPKRAGVFDINMFVESEFGGDCERMMLRVWGAGLKPTTGEKSS